MTDTVTRPVSIEFLVSFCDAFNRHDLDALMAHMTEDCVFDASAGSVQRHPASRRIGGARGIGVITAVSFVVVGVISRERDLVQHR